MNRPILAILSAATLLSGCATILTPSRCESLLSGAQTAEDAIASLQRNFGLSAEKAAGWAAIIMASRKSVLTFCRLANPPIATP